jgi:hypothetical protein
MADILLEVLQIVMLFVFIMYIHCLVCELQTDDWEAVDDLNMSLFMGEVQKIQYVALYEVSARNKMVSEKLEK